MEVNNPVSILQEFWKLPSSVKFSSIEVTD